MYVLYICHGIKSTAIGTDYIRLLRGVRGAFEGYTQGKTAAVAIYMYRNGCGRYSSDGCVGNRRCCLGLLNDA